MLLSDFQSNFHFSLKFFALDVKVADGNDDQVMTVSTQCLNFIINLLTGYSYIRESVIRFEVTQLFYRKSRAGAFRNINQNGML